MGSIEKIEKNKKCKLLSHKGISCLPLSVIFQIKLILAFDLTCTKVHSMPGVVELSQLSGKDGSRKQIDKTAN